MGCSTGWWTCLAWCSPETVFRTDPVPAANSGQRQRRPQVLHCPHVHACRYTRTSCTSTGMYRRFLHAVSLRACQSKRICVTMNGLRTVYGMSSQRSATRWRYTEKAEQAQQHPGINTASNPAEDNRKKQCRPNETKPNSNAIHTRKRHNKPIQNGDKFISRYPTWPAGATRLWNADRFH